MHKQLPRVEVTWVDSKGAAMEWEDMDDLDLLEPDLIHTTGYLLEDKRGHVTIVSSVGTTQVLGRVSIPRCSIKRMRRLR